MKKLLIISILCLTELFFSNKSYSAAAAASASEADEDARERAGHVLKVGPAIWGRDMDPRCTSNEKFPDGKSRDIFSYPPNSCFFSGVLKSTEQLFPHGFVYGLGFDKSGKRISPKRVLLRCRSAYNGILRHGMNEYDLDILKTMKDSRGKVAPVKVGTISLQEMADRTRIKRIDIEFEEDRGKGTGDAAMKLLLRFFNGHPRLKEKSLVLEAAETRLVKWYERLGFKVTDIKHIFGSPLCSMEKKSE